MSITLIVMMVSLVFAYIQTRPVVNIKYAWFLAYQLHLNKAFVLFCF